MRAFMGKLRNSPNSTLLDHRDNSNILNETGGQVGVARNKTKPIKSRNHHRMHNELYKISGPALSKCTSLQYDGKTTVVNSLYFIFFLRLN